MFDLDDLNNSIRIPWLIWIQILIFFLLLFLFYSFTALSSDLSVNNSDNRLISSASASASAPPSNKPTVANLLQHRSQVRGSQSIKGEIATSTSRTIVTGEENVESESFSTNSINIDFHPCSYFRLAKLAFLKCFGLDPTTADNNNCSSSEPKKER
ncbi:uncharacterized protein LOC126654600 [Mercurialis annua]|uniref:uncharacterized protein LOC126654600 n=1 Tax=Mercurialis annua TaxID=3986 RepID=UPI00215E2140|nr:uncharacterized protein LOC126654600 [Mercurialis annua]